MRTTLICVFSFVLMSVTCRKDEACPDNTHNGLKITNQSNIRIRYNIYWNHPDTVIGEYNPVHDGTDGLSPGESFTRGAGPKSCWESVFQNGRKEWIYFFNADTIEALSWDVVRQTNRGLLERKEIDLNYLQQNNFGVIYQ
jgi:hypothetical protein